jgi:hypothetical protein
MLLHELIFTSVVFIVPFFIPFLFFGSTAQFFFSHFIFIYLKPPSLVLSSPAQLFFTVTTFTSQLFLRLPSFISLFEFLFFRAHQAYFFQSLLGFLDLFSISKFSVFPPMLFLVIKAFIFTSAKFTAVSLAFLV